MSAHSTLSRRSSLRLAAVATAALALGGPALAADMQKVRVALSWIPNVEYGGLWVAMEKGYFAEEGLEVEFRPGGPNAPSSFVSLAAGQVDIAYGTWLPFLDAVGRGNDFVMVAATFPVSPLGIISLADNPILKPADIVGKKILAQGANEKTAIDATLKLNDLPVEWEHVPAGFSPEPLLARQGAGYTAFGTNQAVALELRGMKRGEDFHFVSFDELGFKNYASAVFTTRSYLEEQRATLVKFLRALTRGWKDAARDSAMAAQLAVEKYGADLGLNIEQQTRQSALQLKMMQNPANPDQPILALDDRTLAAMFEAAEATGRSNLPDASKIADKSVMQDVHAGLK